MLVSVSVPRRYVLGKITSAQTETPPLFWQREGARWAKLGVGNGNWRQEQGNPSKSPSSIASKARMLGNSTCLGKIVAQVLGSIANLIGVQKAAASGVAISIWSELVRR